MVQEVSFGMNGAGWLLKGMERMEAMGLRKAYVGARRILWVGYLVWVCGVPSEPSIGINITPTQTSPRPPSPTTVAHTHSTVLAYIISK